MIRATTNGVLKTYKSGLMSSFIKLNDARETVLKPRTFQSFADNPAAASQAFQLRRSQLRVSSQYGINTSIASKYESANSCIQSIVDRVDESKSTNAWATILRVMNDPTTGNDASALAKVLDQLADSLVQTMNTSYTDTFIFAGADGLNVPFELKDDGKLYYRGVPVDAGVPNVMTDDNGDKIRLDANGNAILDGSGTNNDEYLVVSGDPHIMNITEYNQAKQAMDDAKTELDTANANGDQDEIDAATEKYNEAVKKFSQFHTPLEDTDGDKVTVDENGNYDPNGEYYLSVSSVKSISQDDYENALPDYEKLKYMEGEGYYVDVGLGFQENEKGELIKSSALNAAIQGIDFLGWGLDEDGDPKNIVSLLKEMSSLCTKFTETGDNSYIDEVRRLAGKFEDGMSNLHVEHTELNAVATKLKTNTALLEDNFYTLTEQISDIEDVDPAEAITSFLWAQYCYSSALKVGNSILSQSLMDYIS